MGKKYRCVECGSRVVVYMLEGEEGEDRLIGAYCTVCNRPVYIFNIFYKQGDNVCVEQVRIFPGRRPEQ
jgi:hypothetical protein